MPPSRTSRPRRTRALVLVTVLTAAVAVVLPTTGASAAKPGSAPPPTITVDDLVSSVTPPTTAGAPTDFVVIGQPLALEVSFSSPLSETKDVTLEVTVTGSTFQDGLPPTFVVPKGAPSLTLGGLVLADAGNDVTLTVSAVAPAKDVQGVTPGMSPEVDVAKDVSSFTITGTAGTTVSRNGVGQSCSLADRATCVDLVLPADPGNGSTAFFSTGVCDTRVGCRTGLDLMQVLAHFSLPADKPASLVIKCNKVTCGGGGVSRLVVLASTSADGLLEPAPACEAKGVMTGPDGYCVDYRQSTRDGAGITYLYLLMTEDARMSF